jgi:hypothetical protein
LARATRFALPVGLDPPQTLPRRQSLTLAEFLSAGAAGIVAKVSQRLPIWSVFLGKTGTFRLTGGKRSAEKDYGTGAQ